MSGTKLSQVHRLPLALDRPDDRKRDIKQSPRTLIESQCRVTADYFVIAAPYAITAKSAPAKRASVCGEHSTPIDISFCISSNVSNHANLTEVKKLCGGRFTITMPTFP